MRLLDQARHWGLAITDGEGRAGTADITGEDIIRINGRPPASAETFEWPREPRTRPGAAPGSRGFYWCNTRHQPYDALVCAVLIRAKVHYGPSIVVASDAGWNGTYAGGRFRPEWLAGRDIAATVFGPDGAPCPFLPTRART